ncbi:MAG: right-handed parallel beta-helix repeat-containing protein [Bacteroidota bacterium]|nr:right-handed parallel beta-helix repeat-containing protein [Bacteroidota bacterium]
MQFFTIEAVINKKYQEEIMRTSIKVLFVAMLLFGAFRQTTISQNSNLAIPQSEIQEDPNLDPNWDWRIGDYPGNIYPYAQYKIYAYNSVGSIVDIAIDAPTGQGNAWSGLLDNLKDDGWVLLQRDFGTPTRAVATLSSGFKVDRPPHFILYNKYRSLLRFFIHVEATGIWTKGFVQMQFRDPTNTNKIPAVLAFLRPVADAIDRFQNMKDNVSAIFSEQCRQGLWLWADFPLSFDPTIAPKSDVDPPSFYFRIYGQNLADIQLKGVSTGVSGDADFVNNFLTGAANGNGPFGMPDLKIPNLGLPDVQLGDLNIKASGTSTDWRSFTNYFNSIKLKVPNVGMDNPFKGLFDGFSAELSSLASALPISLPGLDIGGLFDFFINGGAKAQPPAQPAPTFIALNLDLAGTITNTAPLHEIRVTIPSTRDEYWKPTLGAAVGIVRNDPVGILTLTKTPTIYKKPFTITTLESWDCGHPSCPPKVIYHQFYEYELADAPQISVNSSSDLIFKDCAISIIGPVNYATYQDFQVNKVISWATTNDRAHAIKLETPTGDLSGIFSSLPAPLEYSKGRTLQLPQNSPSSEVKIKVKATLQRADDPNAQPVVFIATYNADIVDRTDLPTEQALPLLPPQNVTATQPSEYQVSINWSRNLETGVTGGGGYNIYRDLYYGTTTLATTKLNSSLLTSTSFTDNLPADFTVPAGTPSGVDLYYGYRIVAVSSDGTVSPSSDYAGVFICRTVTGTISSGLTMSSKMIAFGDITVNSTLTFPASTTLTVQQGTTLKFASGQGLTINGKFVANGISSQLITFAPISGTSPGSWGSVQLIGSGANGSSISYANIQYGTAVNLNQTSNVTIQNCSIINSSSNGIYLYFSSNCLLQNNRVVNSNAYHGIRMDGGSSNNCYDNVIYKYPNVSPGFHNGAGVLYSGCGGYIGQNDIRYYNWGIGCIWGASPSFYNPKGDDRNNRITDCLYGLEIYQQSYPVVCPAPIANFCGNSIYNNSSYNVCYTSGGTLRAEAVYWGGTPPVRFYTYNSAIDYSYYETTDPWYTIPLPSVESGGTATGGWAEGTQQSVQQTADARGEIALAKSVPRGAPSSPTPATPTLFDGVKLRLQNNYKDAKNFFASYLTKNPNNQAAYVELYNCYNNETAADIIKYFESLSPAAAKEHKLLLANLYIMQGDIVKAKKVNNALITTNKNTKLAGKAMLNNFYIALYNENDPQRAETILSDALSTPDLSTPMELADAQHALETYVDPRTGEKPNVKLLAKRSEPLPTTFGLDQNFPNPFNPSTVINYQLPVNSHVLIKVYDILGREVITLVDEEKPAGFYFVQWSAASVSSGVYFYTIRAGNYTAVKKMVITK